MSEKACRWCGTDLTVWPRELAPWKHEADCELSKLRELRDMIVDADTVMRSNMWQERISAESEGKIVALAQSLQSKAGKL